jgi:hypothetical protein
MRILVSIGLTFLLLVACSQVKQNNEPTVGPANFTQQQKNLLDALFPDSMFVFELSHLPEDKRYVKIWIEYYNKGEKKPNIAESSSEIKGDKMTVAFAKQLFTLENKKYESWRIALVEKSGFASSQSEPLKKDDVGKLEMSTKLSEKIPIRFNKPIILATAVNDTNQSNSLSDPSGVFNEKVKHELEAIIKQYEEVYVMKISVMDQRPY